MIIIIIIIIIIIVIITTILLLLLIIIIMFIGPQQVISHRKIYYTKVTYLPLRFGRHALNTLVSVVF